MFGWIPTNIKTLYSAANRANVVDPPREGWAEKGPDENGFVQRREGATAS